MTTKIAKKTVPTKQARKQAPAQPAQSTNERMIRSALNSAKNPGDQRAILAVVERNSEIMAQTIAVMSETNSLMAKLGHIATLKRGLISLAKGTGRL
jgi:hypothetical protein